MTTRSMQNLDKVVILRPHRPKRRRTGEVRAVLEPVERAPLPQAMRHCCSAHSGRPTARRSPKGAGAAWAWSWDLSPEPEEAEGLRRRMDQHPYSGRRPGSHAKRGLYVLRVELVLGFVSPRFCARRRRIWGKHLLVQQRGDIVNW